MSKFSKVLTTSLVAGALALSASSASAWWGGNDYWGGPWGYPGYGWGGYPGYGWGGYPAYGYAPVAPATPATTTAK